MSIAILPMAESFGWDTSTVGVVQSSFFWYSPAPSSPPPPPHHTHTHTQAPCPGLDSPHEWIEASNVWLCAESAVLHALLMSVSPS